jgi:hypothetical protein
VEVLCGWSKPLCHAIKDNKPWLPLHTSIYLSYWEIHRKLLEVSNMIETRWKILGVVKVVVMTVEEEDDRWYIVIGSSNGIFFSFYIYIYNCALVPWDSYLLHIIHLWNYFIVEPKSINCYFIYYLFALITRFNYMIYHFCTLWHFNSSPLTQNKVSENTIKTQHVRALR